MTYKKLLTMGFGCLIASCSFTAIAVEESFAVRDPARKTHTPQAASAGEHAGHNHQGQWHNLGTTPGTGMKVTARQLGKIEAGKEGIFAVELAGTKAPKAVRAWVGVTTAEGSVKAKAEKVGGVYDVHIEVPKALTPSSLLWIEIEPETGKKVKASFSLVRQ